jgi:hypothetical protein
MCTNDRILIVDTFFADAPAKCDDFEQREEEDE